VQDDASLYTSPPALAAREDRRYRHGVVAIAVHGGAGRDDSAERPARAAGVARAVAAGWAALAAGATALDAVVEAVAVLEDDPAFNAGYGAVLSEDGLVELDASVMAGESLAAGAVGAVRGVVNPVRLARAVLAEGREVLLVGRPAVALARRHGLRVCAPGALVTDAARRRWRERRQAAGETVGAVACDARGHVAAATSTGGIAGKRAGRVGDSAVIGAGTYADDTLGAGSATGPGEAIIRLGLVRTALEHVGRGVPPQAAAEAALAALRDRLGAQAGLILVDALGRLGIARTTEAMPAAWRTKDGAGHVA
jgi:beta-aspartyl-peptidase (threonine type)